MTGNAMRRREFITLLGGAAAASTVAWPPAAAMPVVGYLHLFSEEAVLAIATEVIE